MFVATNATDQVRYGSLECSQFLTQWTSLELERESHTALYLNERGTKLFRVPALFIFYYSREAEDKLSALQDALSDANSRLAKLDSLEADAVSRAMEIQVWR